MSLLLSCVLSTHNDEYCIVLYCMCLLVTYLVTVDFRGGKGRHTLDFNPLNVNRVAKGHEEEGARQRRVFTLSAEYRGSEGAS